MLAFLFAASFRPISNVLGTCVRQVFGSFATGLYLPTSDMDLVVTDSGCGDVRQGLRALAQALARKGMAKNMQVRRPSGCVALPFQKDRATLPCHVAQAGLANARGAGVVCTACMSQRWHQRVQSWQDR